MRSFFSNVWHAACYEVKGMPKRPWEWITGIVLPIFWFWFVINSFGSGLMHHLPIGLVNNDGGRVSHSLIMHLDALPSIDWVGFNDRARAEQALRNGETYATLVIPEHFTRDSLNGLGGTVELQINKSYYAIGTTIEVDIKQAFAALKMQAGGVLKTMLGGGSISANQERLRSTIPDAYLVGNPSFNFRPYLLATLIPGLIVLACGLTVIGVLVRDWRDQTMNRWMQSADNRPFAALLGKLLPWTVLYSLIGLGWIAWFAGIQGYAPAGNLWLWMVGMVLLMCATVAYCVLFFSICPSWVIGISIVCMVFAPSFPFTGFSFPFSSMSHGAVYFGQFLPLTHYLQLQGDAWALGSSDAHMLSVMGVLGVMILIPFTIGSLILMKKLPKYLQDEHTQREQITSVQEDKQ